MALLYFGFAVTLAGWTLSGGLDTTREMKYYYLLSVTMLAVLGFVQSVIWRRKRNLYSCGILALILTNIGASLAYRMNRMATGEIEEVSHSRRYFEDMILMCIAFFLVYLIVRYTRIYRIKMVNMIVAAGLPFIFLITRAGGKISGGSYLSFFGLLIFAPVLAGYPFTAAYFLSRSENRYLKGNVRSMPLNQLIFLGYTFLLYIGCVICNEFGLLLVLGITSTFLFYLRSRNFRTKVIYTAVCAGGAVTACAFIGHIRERVYIWMHLSEIGPNDALAAKAESILYLFRNLPRTGFWGNGIGSVPTSVYPTLNTDHVFVALILEYSLIFAAGVLLCGVFYVKAMMAGCHADNLYDYILNLSCALIVGAVILIHIGSNLGSSITAGVGFPYISEGSAVNTMLVVLTAVHCGVYERGRKNALPEEKESYEN